jgi:NAD(P)-dependent dehydrogenase (short-subunit alcohol dehydrogenase family)
VRGAWSSLHEEINAMATQQAPIGSGFGAATTTAEVVRGIHLEGKTVIVTGGNSGLGLETTRTLASAGARVVVPARSREKAASALQNMKGVELESLELSDPSSVNAFADRFLSSERPLHVLVDGAGIMAAPLQRDPRGYESHLSTNHLGHFQLTVRLLPALRRARGARVITVSSWAHRFSPFHFEDPNFERRTYERWAGYGQSKTANILFAVELDRRYAKDGIRAFAVHPGGIVSTGLAKYISQDELRASGAIDAKGDPIIDPAQDLKTPQQGAATTVWCATSHQLDGKGGVYCENVDVAAVSPKDTSRMTINDLKDDRGVKPYAIDADAAHRLWELSEKLTGTRGTP